MDKLSVEQIKYIFSLFYQQQLDTEDLHQSITDNPSFVEIFTKTEPWAYLYELPFNLFLSIFIIEFDLTDIVHKAACSSNHVQSFLDGIEELSNHSPTDKSLSKEEESFRCSLTIALTKQLSSISTHGIPLSGLISKAKNNNDKALFDAILVDRSVMSTPTAAYRIQNAELLDDESFMDELSKAIKKSRPCRRKPDAAYDGLRYILYVLEEQIGLKNIKNKNLLKLMEEELQLYPKGLDTSSLRAFEQFINRLKNKYRT